MSCVVYSRIHFILASVAVPNLMFTCVKDRGTFQNLFLSLRVGHSCWVMVLTNVVRSVSNFLWNLSQLWDESNERTSSLKMKY